MIPPYDSIIKGMNFACIEEAFSRCLLILTMAAFLAVINCVLCDPSLMKVGDVGLTILMSRRMWLLLRRASMSVR